MYNLGIKMKQINFATGPIEQDPDTDESGHGEPPPKK